MELIVAYSIFMNPKLAAHPAYLVGFIALSDGFCAYLGLTSHLICKESSWVVKLFAQTVLFNNNLDRAFEILSNSYLFLLQFSFALATYLEIFISIDLVFTLRNPF